MGAPEIVITDQGREFVNALSSNLYDITKTELRITSAYHLQVTCQCYISKESVVRFVLNPEILNGFASSCLVKVI